MMVHQNGIKSFAVAFGISACLVALIGALISEMRSSYGRHFPNSSVASNEIPPLAVSSPLEGFAVPKDPQSSVTRHFDPYAKQSIDTRFFKNQNDEDLGGHSQGSGAVIHWRSQSNFGNFEGVSPVEVLEVVKHRLTFLQNTAQANDNQAKALFDLSKAIDILKGENVELDPRVHGVDEK